MRIINNNLVFETKAPGQIKALFPQVKFAAMNGRRYCALPHTLDVARVLNNIGLKAPSPIRTQYQWPTAGGRYTPRWYQVDTAEFLTLNPRAHCHNAPRCVDGSTEFLTPTGWKRIDEYKDGDLVAQWNSTTTKAEFVLPNEYISMPCDIMLHIQSSTGIDQMVTHNHRVPYYSNTSKGITFKECLANEIQVASTTKCDGFRGRFPATFTAPLRAGIPLTDEQIRVMVAVIADGYFPYKDKGKCVIRVKKDRKKERLRKLLADSGIQFTEISKDYPTAKGFTIFRFFAPRIEKIFTNSFWLEATYNQLKVVVDEVKYWDSSPRRSTAFAFSTYKKESAEFIQYAASATHRVASLNEMRRTRRGTEEVEYVVYVRGNGSPIGFKNGTRYKPGRGIKEVKAPNGMCYCFSVPSTYFIARRNGCVFITGNTGKTLSSLWAADFLRKQGRIQSTLIVAPLSTLWDVWEQTIFETFPFRTFTVLYGDSKKRLQLLEEPSDFYIINHHGVAIIESALKHRPDINHCIYDEVAIVRNGGKRRKADGPQGTLYEPINRVINDQGIDRTIWGFTGTPTPNAPTDAYGQSKLITPWHVKGKSFTAFKQETMMKVGDGDYMWVPLRSSPQQVARILKPSIRFERTVCTDMEPVHFYRRTELTKQQVKAYTDLKRKSLMELEGQKVTAVNAAVMMSKLLQVALGSVLDVNKEVVSIDCTPRMKLLEELVEANDEKVLVFVPFTAAVDAVAAHLGKRWEVAIIDGRVSTGKRNAIFKEFRTNRKL